MEDKLYEDIHNLSEDRRNFKLASILLTTKGFIIRWAYITLIQYLQGLYSNDRKFKQGLLHKYNLSEHRLDDVFPIADTIILDEGEIKYMV